MDEMDAQIFEWGVEAGRLHRALDAAIARAEAAERRVDELEAELNECDEWRQYWAGLWLWSFAPPTEPLERGWYDVYYWERQEFGEAFYDNGVFSADGDQVFPTHYAPQRNAPGVPPPKPPPPATE